MPEKNVGILTVHYMNNYGTILQTFALREFINRIPGHKAEVINYIPSKFGYRPYIDSAEGRAEMLKKRDRFENFLSEFCGVNTEAISEVKGNDYDYYCVGSDQIWNFRIADKTFLLPDLDPDAVRFAYAASIGLSVDSLSVYNDLFDKYLKAFKGISMRESSQIEYIKERYGGDCVLVEDPTFLLREEDYSGIISKENLFEGEFIFFFWIAHDINLLQGVEFANRLSHLYGIPVVHCIPDAPRYQFYIDGGCMIYEGVEKFLWYIKNAKIVVTNSYHCTLFSIQYKTPFYIFVVESMRSRIDFLKEKYHLDDRIVDRYFPYDKITDEYDFESIYETREKEHKRSVEFLYDMLDVRGVDNE